MNAKFVVIKHPNCSMSVLDKGETIIIFPEVLVHKEVTDRLAYAGCEIVSAGFVVLLGSGALGCCGRSESLNIDSRPEEDSILANAMFGRR